MAQKVQVLLVDDITGGEADETITFGLDGATYEIDLASAGAVELRDLLKEYIDASRKTGGRTKRAGSKAGAGSDPLRASRIRTWAADNGYEVNDRGRVPAHVVEAYEKANA